MPEVYVWSVKRGRSTEGLHRDVSSASAVRGQAFPVGNFRSTLFFSTEADCFLHYLYSEISLELKLVGQHREHTY